MESFTDIVLIYFEFIRSKVIPSLFDGMISINVFDSNLLGKELVGQCSLPIKDLIRSPLYLTTAPKHLLIHRNDEITGDLYLKIGIV